MISSEQHFLFKLLRGDLPSELAGLNTDELFLLFQRHKLFNLAQPVLDLLDDQTRQKWKQAIRSRTIKSLQQASVLSTLIEEYRKEGFDAIPLKGPVLAQTLYGNVAKRHYADLDILVRDAEVHKIIEIAQKKGFVLTHPKTGLSPRQWAYYSRYKKDIGLISRDQGIALELHLSIEKHIILNLKDVDELLRDLEEVELGGVLVECMNKHNTFLYLSMHGSIHQYRRLFWLRDVAEALLKWDLDHNKILDYSKTLKIDRLVGLSVELAKDFFHIEIPSEYHSYLNENRKIILKLKRLALRVILDSGNPTITERFAYHYYMLNTRGGFGHILRILTGIAHRWYTRAFLD